MRALAFTALLAVVAASGCHRGAEPIHIGRKDFIEQQVLAEIARGMLAAKGMGSAEIVNCGDTFGCQQALRAGRIDFMIEYTGTGHFYSSAASLEAPVTLEQLRAAYEPRGLTWLEPLGFDNGYRVVMLVNRATALDVESIADLAAAGGGHIRVACPPTYLRRPRDGLAALLQRHGLRLRGEPMVRLDVDARLDLLRTGEADVAIVYATDGALRGREMVTLEDSLDFFPPYDAAVLARTAALTEHPRLGEALAPLAGTIDVAEMQRLNRAVQVEGWKPAALARRFLQSRGLMAAADKESSIPAMKIAVARGDDLGGAIARATRAVRTSFPERPVTTVPSDDPAALIARGNARLAVVGAERFFAGQGDRISRETRIEAVAVVGNRLVHVVRRQGDTGETFDGAIGIGPSGTGAGRIGAATLAGLGLKAARRAKTDSLLVALAGGDIDAAVLVGTAGDPTIAEALDESFELRSVPAAAAAAAPFLRLARIPPATYRGQPEVLDTLGVQVILAAPARTEGAVALTGPAAALPKAASPLSLAEAQSLVQAAGTMETPDPVLPSAWTTWPAGVDEVSADLSRPSWLQTFINLLTLVFLVWIVLLVANSSIGAPRN